MRRWVFGGVLCTAIIAAWLASRPTLPPSDVSKFPDAAESVHQNDVADDETRAASRSVVDVNQDVNATHKPVEASDLAVGPRNTSNAPTREIAAPPNVRRSEVSTVAKDQLPPGSFIVPGRAQTMGRWTAELSPRLILNLVTGTVVVYHDSSVNRDFFVEYLDIDPSEVRVEPSPFEMYTLGTGHSLGVAFDAQGSVVSVVYGEPNEEAAEIWPASETQLRGLFGDSHVPEPRQVSVEEAATSIRYGKHVTPNICGTSQRFRVELSGSSSSKRIETECMPPGRAGMRELIIIPLTY